jgi:hypothetical protein
MPHAAAQQRSRQLLVSRRTCGEELVFAAGEKPDLIVDSGDLPAVARDLRDLLAESGRLFDRGVPVKVVQPADGGPPIAERLTVNRVVVEAHNVCRPVKPQGDVLVPVTLPNRLARMYLDLSGEWALPPLAGISTAPVLALDGTVQTAEGYDQSTGLWCASVPKLQIPEHPSRAQAEAALRILREKFRTFPFADGLRRKDTALGLEVLDLDELPGHDESTFLVGLLTAVCRPNLWLAPGFLVRAPEISGAGTGKGLLVRSICAIAFGVRPRAFTKGGDRQELDKRLASDLIEAAPTVFLDNANGSMLRSDTLASVSVTGTTRVARWHMACGAMGRGNLGQSPSRWRSISPAELRAINPALTGTGPLGPRPKPVRGLSKRQTPLSH